MSENKQITVIVPTRDRVELTTRAVNSVSSKQPDEIEIVVIDDGGEVPYVFGTNRNIHGIEVVVLRTPQNVGPGLARKFGVDRSSSRAVAFLDSDDVYEDGWLDAVLVQLARFPDSRGLFIAGGVVNGSFTVGATYRFLSGLPPRYVSVFARLVTTMFNPFYTPSVVLSRDLCCFSTSLRHCEDYYTNVSGLFRASRVILLNEHSCQLSSRLRAGQSADRKKMWLGEMSTRRMMFASQQIPLVFKLLVPIGMAYQLVRMAIASIIGSRVAGVRIDAA
jgi:hypothetical protein